MSRYEFKEGERPPIPNAASIWAGWMEVALALDKWVDYQVDQLRQHGRSEYELRDKLTTAQAALAVQASTERALREALDEAQARESQLENAAYFFMLRATVDSLR